MKTETGYSTHPPRGRRFLVIIPVKPDLIDGAATGYIVTQATDDPIDALATRDAPGIKQQGGQVYELADGTPRVLVDVPPLKCAHDKIIGRTRSDGVEVVRCMRCQTLRSINRVSIEGGTFSGDQRRIAQLSARDVADLLDAYRDDITAYGQRVLDAQGKAP